MVAVQGGKKVVAIGAKQERKAKVRDQCAGARERERELAPILQAAADSPLLPSSS